MKKLIAFVLVAVMAVSMVACGSKDKAPLEGTMEENVMKVMEIAPVEFMVGAMPVDLSDTSENGKWALSYFAGLDDAAKITDVCVYEPMMGSQAFSLVMVRTAEGAAPKAVAQEMKDNIDPRKWICVGADEMMVVTYSDVVMLIMLDSQLGLSTQTYVDAFQEVCGAEIDFSI